MQTRFTDKDGKPFAIVNADYMEGVHGNCAIFFVRVEIPHHRAPISRKEVTQYIRMEVESMWRDYECKHGIQPPEQCKECY